jgi:hypothetical protein
MRLRKPVLAQALLLGSFLGALGFLDFYRALYVSELAILCIVALFSWLAYSTTLDTRGVLLNVFSIVGLTLFVLLYAYIFSARTGAPLLPSVLAQRYYVFFLIAPVTYMLYRGGWRLIDFQRIFVLAALLATMSRVIVDLVPPTAPTTSPFMPPPRQVLIFKQDTAYEDYSSLLRRLDASTLFTMLYFGRGLLRARDLTSFGFCLAVTALSLTLLVVNAPRTLIAAALLALVLYGAFLSRPGRTRVLVVLLPLVASVIALYATQLTSVLPSAFGGDVSYETRVQSTQIAWDVVSQYPLLGLGQESAQSISYQDMFGRHFYPTDVGLLGVVFQWGLLGLLLYLYFSVWLVVNLLKLLWAHTGDTSRIRSREQLFLWALFILCLAFAITSVVQARFIKTEGLAIAALSVGFIEAGRHALRSEHREIPRRRPKAAADIQAARRI